MLISGEAEGKSLVILLTAESAVHKSNIDTCMPTFTCSRAMAVAAQHLHRRRRRMWACIGPPANQRSWRSASDDHVDGNEGGNKSKDSMSCGTPLFDPDVPGN